ncbi:succinate dehydrogenase, cytochrome b556 subunit [Marinagarivorans algicola]|uniref:succinate dehydrogenase, cytochrome b556 subunit n=1 Tax=Marinagarivorans algicola TaxID=1513270 RepID=UPI0006B89AD7|nr:succinate dehydrogenase, cytochrome b556 subunit [Marinagarivorans algicola]
MKKDRPVNLDISTISLPVTALVSITHRVSGLIMLGGVLVLLWMLDSSLASEQSFNELKQTLSHPIALLIVWGVLAALAYHTVAGIRHLIMDMGIGETLDGGRTGAKIVIALSAIAILAIGGFLLW